jgi:TonB family protein
MQFLLEYGILASLKSGLPVLFMFFCSLLTHLVLVIALGMMLGSIVTDHPSLNSANGGLKRSVQLTLLPQGFRNHLGEKSKLLPCGGMGCKAKQTQTLLQSDLLKKPSLKASQEASRSQARTTVLTERFKDRLENQEHLHKFLTDLRERIEGEMDYPRTALSRMQVGQVRIGFTLRKNGGIEDIRVLERSRWKQLDEAALATVRRICALLTVPTLGLQGDTQMIVPILFRMKN